MKMIGYVPPVYQLDAMADNMSRRRRSNELNYQRQVYEAIENNNEFEVNLNDEIREIKQNNKCFSRCYSGRI